MKWRCSIILAIMLGSAQVLGAWTHLAPELRHFISIDGAIGYASLTNTSSILKSGSGIGANIGIGYRLLHNDFLFSAGVEGLYVLNAQSMADVKHDSIQTINNPYPNSQTPLEITLHVKATKGLDLCQYVNLNIPILFGMEYRRFYFLTGPKISLNLWGQTKTKSIITTAGDFSKEYDTQGKLVDDMPSHQLGEYNAETNNSLVWEMDVLAHLEVGTRLGDVLFQTGADAQNSTKRFYVAVFLDYGLLNIHKQYSGQHNRLEYNWSPKSSEYFLTPAILSKELGNAKVHQYIVGVKATFLFELPQKKPCVLCKDDNKK